jgi:hypothetical protein
MPTRWTAAEARSITARTPSTYGDRHRRARMGARTFPTWRCSLGGLVCIRLPPVLARAREEDGDGVFNFSILGNDAPLFIRPRREEDPTHVAEEIDVPAPLRRRAARRERPRVLRRWKELPHLDGSGRRSLTNSGERSACREDSRGRSDGLVLRARTGDGGGGPGARTLCLSHGGAARRRCLGDLSSRLQRRNGRRRIRSRSVAANRCARVRREAQRRSCADLGAARALGVRACRTPACRHRDHRQRVLQRDARRRAPATARVCQLRAANGFVPCST